VRLGPFSTCARAAILLALLSLSAQAATFTVYSGASYQPVVAPDSWAVAFGAAIARSTGTATLDSNGQWPTVLAGTTVAVNGQTAELYYVSPGQINFLVPDGAAFGSLSVVITDVSSGATVTSSVFVENTAPGIFSSASSGAGPGAILNGVTYAASPFLVQTPQNGGSDLRTRLAVYCSGVRWAGNPTHDTSVTNAAANVTAQGLAAGISYNFTVEYAGAAPGFFGLDQVNIVLPAQLDGAGTVSLSITAEGTASNVVTFVVNSLPASSLQLESLTLSSSELIGGNSLTGTVSLNGLAKSSGFPVSLQSNLPTLPVPVLVTVSQGQVSATFTIATPVASTVQTATITAQAGSIAQTATVQLDPSTLAQLSAFSVTPSSVQGGSNLTGTLVLSEPAAVAGVSVLISSDNTAVVPPAAVTLQGNKTSTTFPIPTVAVTTPQTANLTATLANVTLTTQATVAPALQLTLAESSIIGGGSLTATIALGTVAPASGANITVTSSAPSVAQPSAGTVTVPADETTTTFAINTFTVTSTRTVTITATNVAAGASQSQMLTVNPQTAGQLQSVTVAPTQVTGGAGVTGTITLTGPAGLGGLVVQLATSNALYALIEPSLVIVPQNSTTATFTIATSHVPSTQTITITATAGGISKTAVLTVN